MFWVDFSGDRINRGSGIETTAPFVSLVTSGIGCAGKYDLTLLATLVQYNQSCCEPHQNILRLLLTGTSFSDGENF